MSITDVAARIQQIQGQFALLGGAPTRTAVAGQATGFAEALSGVTAGGAARGAGPGPSVASLGAPAAGRSTASQEQAVVAEARKYLGVPYVWGGTDPSSGLDCSGLVQLVYKNRGIDLPRVSYQQATQGREVPSLAQARPGDLVAFGSPRVNHIGIYIGDNKMIHAPRPGEKVEVSPVYETPVTIRRILPEQAAAATPVASTGAAGAIGAVGAAGRGGSLPGYVPFSGLFERAGAKYGVPASLLAAVARRESAYIPDAVSPAGARGLMQIMPATARGLGVNPMDPAQAVDGAARLLRDLINRFDRVDHALAAYNAGPGAVIKYGGIPPYAETRAYVPAVLRFQRELEGRAA